MEKVDTLRPVREEQDERASERAQSGMEPVRHVGTRELVDSLIASGAFPAVDCFQRPYCAANRADTCEWYGKNSAAQAHGANASGSTLVSQRLLTLSGV